MGRHRQRGPATAPSVKEPIVMPGSLPKSIRAPIVHAALMQYNRRQRMAEKVAAGIFREPPLFVRVSLRRFRESIHPASEL